MSLAGNINTRHSRKDWKLGFGGSASSPATEARLSKPVTLLLCFTPLSVKREEEDLFPLNTQVAVKPMECPRKAGGLGKRGGGGASFLSCLPAAEDAASLSVRSGRH